MKPTATPRAAPFSSQHAYSNRSRLLSAPSRNFLGNDPSFFPEKPTAQKKRIPNNVNNYDNNILNLSNRKAPALTERGTPLSSYEASQGYFTARHQSEKNLEKPERGRSHEPCSLMHYTRDSSKQEISAHEMENFIHRDSKVPMKHLKEEPLEQYRKVVHPFGNAYLQQSSKRIEPADESRKTNRRMIEERFQGIYNTSQSKSGNYTQRQSQNRLLDRESTERQVVRRDDSCLVSQEKSIDRQQELPVKHAPRSVTAIQTPRPEPELQRPDFSPRPVMCTPCTNRKMVQEQAKQTVKCKHEAEKSQLERLKKELQKNSVGKPSQRNIMAHYYTTTTPRSTLGRTLGEITTNNFINDNFGIEHGKVREQQKEQEREKFRRNVLNNLLKAKQQEIENRKEKLIHNSTTIPNMGGYAVTRIKKLIDHTKALGEQLQNEQERKVTERIHEKELDKLRAECDEIKRVQAIQAQKERSEVIRRSEREGLNALLAEKEQMSAMKRYEKELESSQRHDSEAKFKQYMDSCMKERTALRVKLAAQLQEQIKEKLAEKRGRNWKPIQTYIEKHKPEAHSLCYECHRYVPGSASKYLNNH